MNKNNTLLTDKIQDFINPYVNMKIGQIIINCPYWENKLEDGKVNIRGFQNGKGDAQSIKKEIEKLLTEKSEIILTQEYLRKFAKRNRIGIDCSGFAFRILNELVKFDYARGKIQSLDEIFPNGINKTN